MSHELRVVVYCDAPTCTTSLITDGDDAAYSIREARDAGWDIDEYWDQMLCPSHDTPPAEVRTEPAKALLADILAIVNHHQGRNAEQAMDEIHEACMAPIDRAAIQPAEVRTEWGIRMASGRLFGPYPAEQALSPVDRGRGGVSMSREVHTWVGPWTPTVPPEATDD